MADTRNTIPRQCHTCGSLVTLEAKSFREEVALNWRCLGCMSTGGTYSRDLPLNEARKLAAVQNALAGKRKARVDADYWQERIAERVDSDAAEFLTLVSKGFPEWREHLTYEAGNYLGCSRTLTIPSANPKVETSLTLTVAINEVLISWFAMWHLHISRHTDAGQEDKSHLTRALDQIADLVEERIVAGEHFREGHTSGGGTLLPGQGIPEHWKETLLRLSGGKPVSIVARSWRGTYDEEWQSDSTGEELVTQST